jgi:anti-sigma regulatory factor (Ser/Thr protein kinase)
MTDTINFEYTVDGVDFSRAGEASADIKQKLKQMGVDFTIIRKIAIAMYEGEINLFIHAHGGKINVSITATEVCMVLSDHGPGIVDIDKAMRAGYSTAPDNARELGFGAGMGLPNMKKNSDEMKLESKVGIGTTVTMKVYL